MDFQIIEEPYRFRLHGIRDVVEGGRHCEFGLRLMNELWRIVKGANVRNTGINHWVYLPQSTLFVGVELQNPQPSPPHPKLEPLEFELRRYLKYVHIGPYQELPQTWNSLRAALAASGEVFGSPSLEIYGHPCDDPAELQTTLWIGLREKPA